MIARSSRRAFDAGPRQQPEQPDLARRLEVSARRVYTNYNGRRIAWRQWGGGPPVVLLHGGFGSWTHWVRTIPDLSRHYSVIAPDMPGFGDSDLPDSDDLLQAIPRALIAGMPEVLGQARRFDLVGFSFGSVMAGQVAAELAEADGQIGVGQLILVAPAGLGVAVTDFASLARPRPGMTQDEIAAVHRHNMAIMLFKNASAIDDTAVRLQIANTRRANAQGRPYSRSDALVNAAARFRPRRLFAVWGEGDAYALRNLSAYEDAVARLRRDIRIHRITAAGHWVQYEAAAAFNAFLMGALREGGRS